MKSLLFYVSGLVCLAALLLSCEHTSEKIIARNNKRLLVITGNAASPIGKTLYDQLQKLARDEHFSLISQSLSDNLTEDTLKHFSSLAFIDVDPATLTINQQADVERYIQAGGGLLIANSPLNVPYTWPWYASVFSSQKSVESSEAILPVRDTDKESPFVQQPFDGGRIIHVTRGSVSAQSLQESLLRQIDYLIGDNTCNYEKASTLRAPLADRFTKVVLDDYDVNEPMELAVLPNGKVIYIERRGKMKMYHPESGQTSLMHTFDVCTSGNYEDGLLGLAIDPDFEQNHYLYLYYSPSSACQIDSQYLSRFTMRGDSLILASEKVMLGVPVQRQTCCHSGGSIAFGPDGNLFLSTGDNTSSKESNGYTPIDERPGRGPFDAQKSSANTHDLRGKILRIKPHPYGTYTIPDGNLFPKDGLEGRPEIYVMGARNPFRISIDARTRFLYWGDVGPDAGKDGTYGPQSYDEWNQAREPGYFGWPYFMGNNIAFPDRDFTTDAVGAPFDPARPVNNSPNNTGSQLLPPAREAYIWYPKGVSPEFPMLGRGSNSAMAGPVYYAPASAQNSPVKLPAYFEGKLFIYEWARSWIKVITMNDQGDLIKIEPFLPNEEFVKPIEMEVGPDGALYVLEYGQNYFMNNPKARLSRIEYAAGNRLPVPKLIADKQAGAVPMSVQFDAGQSFDYDQGDQLTYTWRVEGETIGDGESVSHTFDKPGMYTVSLAVEDQAGGMATAETTIRVGNSPPEVSIAYEGNQTFFLGEHTHPYAITVVDPEDESSGGIKQDNFSASFVYVDDGNDLEVMLGEKSAQITGSFQFLKGYNLIENSDCWSCHDLKKRSVGPSYYEISERYQGNGQAVTTLAEKIITGGNGNWGEKIMSGHPQHTQAEAAEMVRYILSLTDQRSTGKLPLTGRLTTDLHPENPTGAYLLAATYTDKGANGIEPLSTREILVLKAPVLEAEDYDRAEKSQRQMAGKNRDFEVVSIRDGGYIAFTDLDLSYISQLRIRLKSNAKAKLSLRLGTPQGNEIGSASLVPGGANDSFVQISIPVQPNTGLQDLFLVGESSNEGKRALFSLDRIEVEAAHGL